jgi:hypothetical protein
MSPIERGELENSVNAQIVGIVVLSRLLKWIKSSSGRVENWHAHHRLRASSHAIAWRGHNSIESIREWQ